MWLWLQLCVWESNHEVNVTFTGLATSFAKTCLLSVHSILWLNSLDMISTLTIIFMRYEMLLIKWIFSFPAPKFFLQFQINYKIGFALWYPLFCFRYLFFSIATLLRKRQSYWTPTELASNTLCSFAINSIQRSVLLVTQ